MDKHTDERTKWIEGWMEVQMDTQTNGWLDEGAIGWTNAQMGSLICLDSQKVSWNRQRDGWHGWMYSR